MQTCYELSATTSGALTGRKYLYGFVAANSYLRVRLSAEHLLQPSHVFLTLLQDVVYPYVKLYKTLPVVNIANLPIRDELGRVHKE